MDSRSDSAEILEAMRVSVVAVGVVIAGSIATARAETAAPDASMMTDGPLVGVSLSFVGIQDNGYEAPFSGYGPLVEVTGGWWFVPGFGLSLSGSLTTMGTDLPVMLNGQRDHLRQWDLAVMGRVMVRPNHLVQVGLGLGVLDDRASFTGISTAQTSRIYDLIVMFTPTQVAGHPLDVVARGSEAPTQDGAYPIYTLGIGLGTRL